MGIGAQVSLQFGSNELIKKLLFKIYDEYMMEDDDDAETLPMSLVLASGLLTGIPSSLSVVNYFVTKDTCRSYKNLDAGSERQRPQVPWVD